MIMKKITTTIALSSVAIGLLLTGCGSSDTTSATTTNGSSVGYFIDAAVENAHYKTSSGREGETDAQGKFEYQEGDSVTFSLGKLHLGETKPTTNGLVTPKDLADTNDTVILMLQMLQSLDSDGNVSNGITIDQETIDKLSALDTNISLSDINESTLISLDTEHNLGLDEDGDGHLDTDKDEAVSHMNESVYKWNKEHKQESNSGDSQEKHFNLSEYLPSTTLTQDLKDSLAYMGNEERLAYDVYMNLYNYHLQNSALDIKQFYNIASNSESEHIAIVQSLVQRYDLNASDFTNVNETIISDNNMSAANMPSGVYDIPAIQNLYDTLFALGQSSQESALKVGCMVEVTDVNDLDEYIIQAEESNATDVKAAFETLRDGSYNHYWSFDKALKNMGVTNGCYYEGDELLTNKEGVYPKNENEQNGQENGNHQENNGEEAPHGNGKQKGRS